VFQEVFDLDRRVVGQPWKFGGKPFDNAMRVGRTVQKIRIPEADVLRAGGNLLADVREHRIYRNRVKPPFVDRHDRTVAAQMLAAACRVGAADHARRAVGHLQLRIVRKREQITPMRNHVQSPVHL
jgi:hypothetical protein